MNCSRRNRYTSVVNTRCPVVYRHVKHAGLSSYFCGPRLLMLKSNKKQIKNINKVTIKYLLDSEKMVHSVYIIILYYIMINCNQIQINNNLLNKNNK